ncbi:MAG: 30S ribosomal protein S17 [Candidatus Nanohalarchaeota archaeon]|nr:MAG: 30S ribosomal protein S17 [Candidatus Nanohaloarchaeota archaeon]
MKNIGLEVNVKPKEECHDSNCPFHSTLKIRGNVFEGVVVSDKMDKTAVVEMRYLHKLKKYKVYERRKTKLYAHIPECLSAKKGDLVKIAECRPISKTKKFVLIDILNKD